MAIASARTRSTASLRFTEGTSPSRRKPSLSSRSFASSAMSCFLVLAVSFNEYHPHRSDIDEATVLLVHPPIHMPPIDEVSEVDQRMLDRVPGRIWLEVAIGYVSLVCRPMWQYVVPGTILRWSRTRYRFVPIVGSFELGIDANNNTPVVEQFVGWSQRIDATLYLKRKRWSVCGKGCDSVSRRRRRRRYGIGGGEGNLCMRSGERLASCHRLYIVSWRIPEAFVLDHDDGRGWL